MDTRTAILIYQYSERIKSGLIIASKLVARLTSLKGEAQKGAEEMMASYLEALVGEIRIAQNVERSIQFLEAERKILEAIGKVELSEYAEINKRISEALTHITTSCQWAMEALEKKNLL